MQYSEKELELNLRSKKIQDLEIELHLTKELLTTCIESLKDTQRYLMKMAYNQSEITKRVASWPYIVVSSTGNDGDEDSNY